MKISFAWPMLLGIIALIVGVALNSIPWGLLGIGLQLVTLIIMAGGITAAVVMFFKQNQTKR